MRFKALKILLAASLLTGVICGLPTHGHAAQDSTVVTENTPIRLEPSPDAKPIDYLALGTEVRISSYPLAGGWYRVRARTGDYGWVHESDLSVRKMPRPLHKMDTAMSPEESEYEPPGVVRPERDRLWHLKGVIGVDFFSPSDLNGLFGFSELSTGYIAGGEIGRFVTPKLALGLKFDVLSKDVVAKESRTAIVYNLALRSYPMMAGFDYFFWKAAAFRFSLGVFGGMAFGTSFSSEALTLGSPNVVVLSTSPMTGLLRLSVTRPLGRIVSVGSELGYRILKSDGIATESAATTSGGSQIFGRSGVYSPREIDLSGPYLTVSLGIHF